MALYPEQMQRVNQLVQQTGRLLGEVVQGQGGVVDSPSLQQTLSDVDNQLNGFLAAYSRLQGKCQASKLSVAVLALAKSGKSTLLNAICGYDLLPSNNVPETARICRLVHDRFADEPVLRELRTNRTTGEVLVLHQATGLAAIHEYLMHVNAAARQRFPSDSQEDELEVRLRIAALAGLPAQQQVALELIDTPGTNEAGEERLKHQVERLLATSVDAVLYILDYTKLKTQEEANILTRLKEVNPALLQRLSTRLFFVVNKAEEASLGLGLDAEETAHYVAQLITEQMGIQSFQLQPEQVLLVSSRNALLGRLHVMGRDDKRHQGALRQIAFGAYANKVNADEVRSAAHELLKHSGVPDLEDQVISFLYELAGALKIQSLGDDLSRLLQQLENVFATHRAALQQDVHELMANESRLQMTLSNTLPRFDEVQERTTLVEGLVCDMVRTRMEHLKNHLYQRVTRALDGATQEDEAVPLGRWASVWRAARSLFSDSSDRQRTEAEALLRDLHMELTQEMTREVSDFWGHLEVVLNDQQRVLFDQLNSHIRDLGRAIEEAVAEHLDLQLQPADLSLAPPSPEQFHFNLQELVATSTVQRHREETVTEHQPCRSSLCQISSFFATPCPACRDTRYSRLVEVYEVSPERVQAFFLEAINGTVDASNRSVRSFVRSYICSQVEEARKQLTQYGERFTATMLKALDAARRGEESRQAELQRVSENLIRVRDLQQQVQVLLNALDASAEPELTPIPAAAGLPDLADSIDAAVVAPVGDVDTGKGAGSVAGVNPNNAIRDCKHASVTQQDSTLLVQCPSPAVPNPSMMVASPMVVATGLTNLPEAGAAEAAAAENDDPYVRQIKALAAATDSAAAETATEQVDPIVALMQQLTEQVPLYNEAAAGHPGGTEEGVAPTPPGWRISVGLGDSSDSDDENYMLAAHPEMAHMQSEGQGPCAAGSGADKHSSTVSNESGAAEPGDSETQHNDAVSGVLHGNGGAPDTVLHPCSGVVCSLPPPPASLQAAPASIPAASEGMATFGNCCVMPVTLSPNDDVVSLTAAKYQSTANISAKHGNTTDVAAIGTVETLLGQLKLAGSSDDVSAIPSATAGSVSTVTALGGHANSREPASVPVELAEQDGLIEDVPLSPRSEHAACTAAVHAQELASTVGGGSEGPSPAASSSVDGWEVVNDEETGEAASKK